MEIVEIKDLTYKYPTSKEYILKNVNLKLKKGELCALIGPNGSGKTTLCNAIRGFIPYFYNGEIQGEVWIDGKNMTEYTLGELAMKVGFVFQNPFIQISGVKDTVFEEISYGLENLGIDEQEIIKRIEEVMKILKIEYLRDKNPFELSGGQRQRVALASIIVMEPDILVIDEPTSQLDPQGTEEVFQIIKLMKEKGKTIVLVEHKIELIAEYADHVVLINDGTIVMDGDTKKILSDKKVLEYKMALPQYAMLGYEMKKRGMNLNSIPITEAEATEEIKAYMESL